MVLPRLLEDVFQEAWVVRSGWQQVVLLQAVSWKGTVVQLDR